MNPRYVTMSFTLAVITFSQAFADTDEAQVSWKYLVQRTITKKDNINGREEVHTDRALLYYGAGAKKPTGQREGSSQVVYIDQDGNRLPDEQAPTVHPFNPLPVERLAMTGNLPKNYGANQQKPLPVSALGEIIDVFPMAPKMQLESGMIWTSNLYLCFNGQLLWFSASINHEVAGYKKFKGRRCAVINYSLQGKFSSDEHPERFDENTLKELRGEYFLKGSGSAYFDTAEEIIVEKEQTIYWTSFGEKLSRLEDGSVDWVPTVDEERVVTIKVALQPEEEAAVETEDEVKEPSLPASSGWASLSYVLIAAVVGIVAVLLFVLLSKTARK